MGKGSSKSVVGILLSAAVALAGCSRAEAAAISPREFQDRLIAEIQRQHPKAKVARRDDSQLDVRLPHGEGGTLHLERAYEVYRGNPGELDVILRNFAASVGPHAPATVESLLVLVRHRDSAPSVGTEAAPLMKPLVGDLAAFVAVDRPDSYAIARSDELRSELKLSEADIWAAALKNTRSHLTVEPRPIPAGRPAEISTGEGLAASLLLIDEFWDAKPMTSDGPLVVAPLARDVLIVARLSDTALVQSMRKMMAEVRDDPNGITNDLIVRRDGRWHVLR